MKIEALMNKDYRGLWQNNPAFVQLLGLCPLLATSTSLVNGLAMGLITTLVLLLSATLVAILRYQVDHSVRLPMFMLIIAGAVTAVELLMKAYFYPLYLTLGLFIPLIVTNCMIIGRAEAFSSKNSVPIACWDALTMGIGFSWVITVLGGVREILSKGTLFSGLDLLLGERFRETYITITDPQTFFLSALPAGAFIIFGLMLAVKQWIDLSNY